MSGLARIAAVSAAAILLCSACGGEVDERSVLFSQCEKEKEHTTEECQCRVDAQFANYDKDMIRLFVLRAQEKHAEADTLMRSIPDERATAQTIKYAYAATECTKGGT